MAINLNHQLNKISSSSQVLTVDQDGAIIVPIGTTSGRSQTGVETNGSLRYNTDTHMIEHYSSSTWKNVVSYDASASVASGYYSTYDTTSASFKPSTQSLQSQIDESAIAFAIALGG